MTSTERARRARLTRGQRRRLQRQLAKVRAFTPAATIDKGTVR